MSQLYSIELKSAVTERIETADSVAYPIALQDILPQEDMKDLLRESLVNNGFEADEENENILTKQGAGGEDIIFNLDDMEVTARLEDAKDVTAEVNATGRAYDDQEMARRNAQEKLKAQEDAVRRELAKETSELQSELSDRLAESESERMREINEVLQDVYADALKRKAGQMGDIMEVHESTSPEGEYELTIRIEN